MKTEQLSQIFKEFPAHEQIFDNITQSIKKCKEIPCAYLSGSFARNNADEYSDIDITVFVNNRDIEYIYELVKNIAEDVHEVMFMHCIREKFSHCLTIIYEKDVKCDIHYHSIEKLNTRTVRSGSVILKDANRKLSKCFSQMKDSYQHDFELPSFLENVNDATKNACLWIRFILTKLKRGELFAAIHGIESFRTRVIFELACYQQGIPVKGVRHFENLCSSDDLIHMFAGTLVKGYTKKEIASALKNLIILFGQLRITVYDSKPDASLCEYESYLVDSI